MRNKQMLLLRTLLYSPGGFNAIRHETDKKKKGRMIGSMVGVAILYVFVGFFAVWISVGCCLGGLSAAAPRITALIVSALGFINGFMRSNGYLFGAKDYEMLMALPFSEKTVVSAKFLCMYIRSIAFSMVLSVSVLIGYSIVMQPGVLEILIWLLLTFVLPMIPMVIGAGIGALAAAIGSRFRYRNVVQTVLIFAFVLLAIGFRFIANRLFAPQYMNDTMTQIDAFMGKTDVYFPIRWYSDAVLNHNAVSFLLLLVLSLAVYELAFFLISRRYRAINSRLIGHERRKKFKMGEQKAGTVVNAIAKKDLKRFTSSSTYMVNMGIGQVIVVILSVALLIAGPEKILGFIMPGIENAGAHTVLIAVVPALLCFFGGIGCAATCAYSMEGKSVWILQSLPIRIRNIVRGKMRFNLWVTWPFLIVGCVLSAIALKAGPLYIILNIVLATCYTLYTTTFGMFLGILHGNTEWTAETDVVKRSAAVTIYIFANMGITMGLFILSIVLGMLMEPWVPMLIMIGVSAGLALLFYRLLLGAAKKHLW